jgi:DNA-binding cell septation regulator SpoVG
MSLQITNFSRIAGRPSLRAFFTIELPSGMAIHSCSLHEKNGSRWVAMPAEKRTNREDGKTSYKPLVEFISRQVADNFRRQVIQALEAEGLA